MELKEAIEKRRTVRDFKKKHIAFEIIRYAIENAFKAPSYNHFREWNFIIIKKMETKLKIIESESLDKKINLAELKKSLKNEAKIMMEMYLNAIPKQKRMILNAPVVVVLVFKPKMPIEKVKKIYDLNCLASAWCCIENLLLSLAEHNIYGVTFIPQNIEKIKENLKIPKEKEIAAIIPIGYKDDYAKILKQKTINISERISFERYK